MQHLWLHSEVEAVVGLVAVPHAFECPFPVFVTALFDAREHAMKFALTISEAEFDTHARPRDQILVGPNLSEQHAAARFLASRGRFSPTEPRITPRAELPLSVGNRLMRSGFKVGNGTGLNAHSSPQLPLAQSLTRASGSKALGKEFGELLFWWLQIDLFISIHELPRTL
jgi:hypothetical protein